MNATGETHAPKRVGYVWLYQRSDMVLALAVFAHQCLQFGTIELTFGATAAANGIDIEALRSGTLRLDPGRARAIALASLDADPHRGHLDAVDVEVVGNRVTVSLRDHVRFSLLGIFMGGKQFKIAVHAPARPEERP